VRTGICTADRSRRVVHYPARVQDGEVVVTLPDRAPSGAA
jgi:nitrite reductase/ring-hydroxylating ferredoxin subunit